MGWALDLFETSRIEAAYAYAMQHPEAAAALLLVFLLLVKGNFREALLLTFGATLCWANYYMLAKHMYFTIPTVYSAGFAALSVVALILLVYHMIQAA